MCIYGALKFGADILSNGRSALWSRVSAEMTVRVASFVFTHIHSMSLSWHLNRKSGRWECIGARGARCWALASGRTEKAEHYVGVAVGCGGL